MTKKREKKITTSDLIEESTAPVIQAGIEAISLDQFEVTKEQLSEFLKNFENLVITPDTLPEVKKHLSTLRAKRYEIQNKQKANDKARIEWNTKFMNSNRAKGDELLEMFTPIEGPIAAKVKEIDDAIQAEKDKAAAAKKEAEEARTKQITDTGAVPVDGGYGLQGEWISMDEIKGLPESVFNKVVEAFKAKKKEIDDAALAEKEMEQKIKLRAAKLYEIGMLRAEDRFVMPFPSATYITDEQIKTFEDISMHEFSELVVAKMKEKENADAELQRQQDQFKKDQEALQEEKDKIAAEKKALLDERTKDRKDQLRAIGFIDRGGCLAFSTVVIFDELIIAATPIEWTEFFKQKSESAQQIKDENARIDALNKCIEIAKLAGFEIKDDGDGKYFWKMGVKFTLANFSDDPKKFDKILENAETKCAQDELKRKENLRPNKEKIQAYLNALMDVPVPNDVKSIQGVAIMKGFDIEFRALILKANNELQ